MIPASNRQYFGAGAMAMLVHGLLFVGLVFSVSWRSLPELPVYADLWTELPALPEPPKPVEETAVPPPEPVEPPPVAEPEPDIALKAKEEALLKVKREQARREAQARKAAEEARRQEEARQREEESRRLEEQRRAEDSRRLEEARQLAREQSRRELEEEMARQMQEELAQETSQIRRKAAAQSLSVARARMIHDFQDRIRSKIRGYLRLRLRVCGNAEVVFQARLLPDGEVLKLTLVKSSGQPAYDEEVERAILKASPLPLPPDREAAAAFRDGLTLKFRPREEEGARS